MLDDHNIIRDSEKLQFLPNVPFGQYLSCLLWLDYPDTRREADKCDGLTPQRFSQFISANNIRTYVKGHHHQSAAEMLDLGDDKSIHILISSLFMTKSTIGAREFKETYEEKSATNTIEMKRVPSSPEETILSATILYVNRAEGIVRQYPTYDARHESVDPRIIFTELQAYYREFFGRQVLGKVVLRGHYRNIIAINWYKMENKLMKDAGLPFDEYAQSPSPAHCNVIHDLFTMLDQVQGSYHDYPPPTIIPDEPPQATEQQ